MRHAFPVLALATLALPLGACSDYASDRPGPGYRDDGGYVLNDNDPVYRDNNGNYYCKKPDGTTGAIWATSSRRAAASRWAPSSVRASARSPGTRSKRAGCAAADPAAYLSMDNSLGLYCVGFDRDFGSMIFSGIWNSSNAPPCAASSAASSSGLAVAAS